MRRCAGILFVVGLAVTTAWAQGEAENAAENRPLGREHADVDQAEPGGRQGSAIFAAIDADGDGVITKAELRKAIVAIRSLDADGDGNITLAEASPGGPEAGPQGAATPLVDRMLQYDTNGDGMLSPGEVPQQFLPMLQDADRNSDGALDRAELAAVADRMKNFQGGAGGPGREGDRNPATRRMLQYDRDGDGRLSANEIPPQLRNMFRPGDDLNQDGAVDAAELQAVLARMGGQMRSLGADPAHQGKPFRDPDARTRKGSRGVK